MQNCWLFYVSTSLDLEFPEPSYSFKQQTVSDHLKKTWPLTKVNGAMHQAPITPGLVNRRQSVSHSAAQNLESCQLNCRLDTPTVRLVSFLWMSCHTQSSCTFIIKKSHEKSRTQKIILKNYTFSKYFVKCFACFSFYFYSSWPIEMSMGRIWESTNHLSVALTWWVGVSLYYRLVSGSMYILVVFLSGSIYISIMGGICASENSFCLNW